MKLKEDTNMYGKIWTGRGIEALWKDLKAMCNWSEKWQMNFNVDKLMIVHFGAKNTKAENKMDKLKLAKITEV